MPEADDDADLPDSTLDGPESAALASAEGRVIWRHIESLSERCRSLLRVVAFSDRPDYASVAQALGMPVGSIGPTRGRCLAASAFCSTPTRTGGSHDRRRELPGRLDELDRSRPCRSTTPTPRRWTSSAIYEVGDPVPSSLLDRVKFAITLDDLEAEVARLQREAVPELEASGPRTCSRRRRSPPARR